MARCKGCGQRIGRTSCTLGTVFVNGKKYERIRIGSQRDIHSGMKTGTRCGECGAERGTYHHWGCDQELCPACGFQLRSCFCKDVHIVGVKIAKPTQEELRAEYAWITLDPKVWEIALITERMIFCRFIGEDDAEGMVRAYNTETRELLGSQNDGWVSYYKALYHVIINRESPVFISDAAESFLIQAKKELYERIIKK